MRDVQTPSLPVVFVNEILNPFKTSSAIIRIFIKAIEKYFDVLFTFQFSPSGQNLSQFNFGDRHAGIPRFILPIMTRVSLFFMHSLWKRIGMDTVECSS